MRRIRHKQRSGTASDGFTLIEVLVAFTVLAMIMVVIQSGVIGSADGVRHAEMRAAAEMVARNLLAEPVRTDADALAPEFGTAGGFDWAIRYEPVAQRLPTPQAPVKWAPVRVIVNVSTRGSRSPLVSVETVRLAPTPTAS